MGLVSSTGTVADNLERASASASGLATGLGNAADASQLVRDAAGNVIPVQGPNRSAGDIGDERRAARNAGIGNAGGGANQSSARLPTDRDGQRRYALNTARRLHITLLEACNLHGFDYNDLFGGDPLEALPGAIGSGAGGGSGRVSSGGGGGGGGGFRDAPAALANVLDRRTFVGGTDEIISQLKILNRTLADGAGGRLGPLNEIGAFR